jgi:hypothetical protein
MDSVPATLALPLFLLIAALACIPGLMFSTYHVIMGLRSKRDIALELDEMRNDMIEQMEPRITVTCNEEGEVVAVTLTDNEYRIARSIWERE